MIRRLLSITCICALSCAANDSANPPPTEKNAPAGDERHFDTATPELRARYQKINAALLMHSVDSQTFRGPHEGPGVIFETQGNTMTIKWPWKGEHTEWPSRIIPFSAIIAVDHPMPKAGRTPRRAVFYRGPFGDVEFAILVLDGPELERFISRWRSAISPSSSDR